jgi:hypothetical protein
MVLCPARAIVFERIVRRPLITAWLDQDVNYVAVLSHCSPQVVLLAVDSNEDFIQVPAIAEVALTPLQTTGIARPNF